MPNKTPSIFTEHLPELGFTIVVKHQRGYATFYAYQIAEASDSKPLAYPRKGSFKVNDTVPSLLGAQVFLWGAATACGCIDLTFVEGGHDGHGWLGACDERGLANVGQLFSAIYTCTMRVLGEERPDSDHVGNDA